VGFWIKIQKGKSTEDGKILKLKGGKREQRGPARKFR